MAAHSLACRGHTWIRTSRRRPWRRDGELVQVGCEVPQPVPGRCGAVRDHALSRLPVPRRAATDIFILPRAAYAPWAAQLRIPRLNVGLRAVAVIRIDEIDLQKSYSRHIRMSVRDDDVWKRADPWTGFLCGQCLCVGLDVLHDDDDLPIGALCDRVPDGQAV